MPWEVQSPRKDLAARLAEYANPLGDYTPTRRTHTGGVSEDHRRSRSYAQALAERFVLLDGLRDACRPKATLKRSPIKSSHAGQRATEHRVLRRKLAFQESVMHFPLLALRRGALSGNRGTKCHRVRSSCGIRAHRIPKAQPRTLKRVEHQG